MQIKKRFTAWLYTSTLTLTYEKPLQIEVEEPGQHHTIITSSSWLDHQCEKVSVGTNTESAIHRVNPRY